MSAASATFLERLRDSRDAEAWGQLNDLYAPLVRTWAERFGVRGADADDLVHDVMAAVVRRFPEFQHPEQPGAFRAWFRSLAVNSARESWRARRFTPRVPDGSDFDTYLKRLDNPADARAREWDREHDLHVVRRMLDRIKGVFEGETWALFRGFVLEGHTADAVAAANGATLNAVYIARSRVLARLREEAAGLLS